MFIVAKYASLDNLGTSLNLSLQEGKVVRVTDIVNQIDFKKMVINNEIVSAQNINTFKDLVDYWKTQKDKFAFYLLGSILPFISIFFIIYIGYFNPRYNKNYTTVLGIAFTVTYVVLIHQFSKEYGMVSLYYIPIVWFSIGLLIYRYRIRPYY